jgi:hypothetical protein
MGTVYKLFESQRGTTLKQIIDTFPDPRKILIVFWHGLGDTLMFLPLYEHFKTLYPQHHFDLSLLPGVGQDTFLNTLALPEDKFVESHDCAFVISFPMVEGSNKMTKSEYCCVAELGIEPLYLGLPKVKAVPNKMVAVHLQGTCLPGSTNPDYVLAKRIWDDIVAAGYVPFDVHFKHVFHNPVNEPFTWVNRSCRDLKPDINTLQMILQNSMAFVGVASGPFVLAMAMDPQKVIYLQKHHTLNCYVKEPVLTVNLLKYESKELIDGLNEISVRFQGKCCV